MTQNNITEQSFWENIYSNDLSSKSPIPALQAQKKSSLVKFLFKKIVGSKNLEKMDNYSNYILWNRIYPYYLKNFQNKKIVEIGSAPGKHLVKIHQKFGLVPYGIEYTQSGAEINRSFFELHGIPSKNVIQENFFSEKIEKEYKEYFDVVISRGFIEHFTNPKELVERHVHLLKAGGLLIVSIPNLVGFNAFFMKFFNPALIKIHNLEIMKRKNFQKIFDIPQIEPLFSGYYGTFNPTLCL